MKIVTDLDGTIFMTYERLKEAFKAHFHYSYSLILLVRGDKLNQEEKQWVVEYFQSDVAFNNLPPYRNAVAVLQSLAKKNDLYFIATRPFQFLELTSHELTQLGLPINNFFCITRSEKINFINNLNPDWIIEDEYELALEIALTKRKTIILEREWNLDYLIALPKPAYLIKATNWLEVKEIIDNSIRKGVK